MCIYIYYIYICVRLSIYIDYYARTPPQRMRSICIKKSINLNFTPQSSVWRVHHKAVAAKTKMCGRQTNISGPSHQMYDCAGDNIVSRDWQSPNKCAACIHIACGSLWLFCCLLLLFSYGGRATSAWWVAFIGSTVASGNAVPVQLT